MAQNFKEVGLAKQITGTVSGIVAGALLRKGLWCGVVQRDITGTSQDEVTIDGRPIINLPGETATKGDGKGVVHLEGVHTFNCSGVSFVDGQAVFANIRDSEYKIPSAAQVSNSSAVHIISGVLLGYAYGASYTVRDHTQPANVNTDIYWGPLTPVVVDVKLIGVPLGNQDIPKSSSP